MNSRERLPRPTPHEVLFRDPHPLILIQHPASNDVLFAFPALSTGSSTTPYGVFRPLVLDACRVVTNHAANCQGDFLASDRQGRHRIPIDDTPLEVNCYYFLGPGEDEANRNYPVVESFSAFTFPPVLPDRWARLSVPWEQRNRPAVPGYCKTVAHTSAFVAARDRTCVITRYPDSTQRAYIVPKAEEAWFHVNGMVEYFQDRYSPSNGERWYIDHPGNGMLLRADVHLCLERHGFVFYPDSGPGPGPGADGDSDSEAYVTYFLGRGWWCLPDLFHRRRVPIDPEIPVEFLYARFAYAVINISLLFTLHSPFIRRIPEPPTIAVVREKIRKREEKERERQEAKRRRDEARRQAGVESSSRSDEEAEEDDFLISVALRHTSPPI